MLCGIIAINFVDDLGRCFESAIAMSEALRYVDLVPLGSAEHGGEMAPEGWRAPPYVDGDIEDRTRRDAHQLGLREWRDLEMQSSNHPFACRQ